MFSTLLFIILTWGFVALNLIGIGLLAQKGWGRAEDSFQVVIDAFWLGFAFLVFFLQIWNSWFPVNIASFFVLSSAGLIGILLNLKFFLRLFPRINVILALFIGAAAIFLSGVASFPYFREDHGAYYSNLIQWARSFPIVKGIGNLGDGFAYNNAYFLYKPCVSRRLPRTRPLSLSRSSLWQSFLKRGPRTLFSSSPSFRFWAFA
jgi:hypothetical protein